MVGFLGVYMDLYLAEQLLSHILQNRWQSKVGMVSPHSTHYSINTETSCRDDREGPDKWMNKDKKGTKDYMNERETETKR